MLNQFILDLSNNQTIAKLLPSIGTEQWELLKKDLWLMGSIMKKLLFIIPLILTGCSNGIMTIPSSEVIDSTGKIVTKTASTVGDTSSYRTHEKYSAWNVANREYTKAVQASGFQMEFAMVKVNGIETYLPKKISFRQRPDFHAPADLKDHPVWGTINTAIKTITPWGFGSWAATSIIDSMEEIAKVPTYAGPVQMSGSYNNAGHDVTTYNGPLQQDQSTRTSSPGMNPLGNAICDAEFVAKIPGCSGCESYLAGNCIVKP